MFVKRVGCVLAVIFVVTSASAATPSAKDCIKAWPVPRFNGVGFNHLVHISNACAVAADCVITTDVNPEPTKAVAPPKADIEVNTFLGSPARVFTPKVDCTMRAQ
ncbi:MAG: hypothetical protein ABIP89_18695 [Polyangiaceae bacterium]